MPVAGYIVDLLAPEVRLVVEIDGGYHRKRACADARRDAVLRRLGFRVLRIPNEVVLRDLTAAIECIRAKL